MFKKLLLSAVLAVLLCSYAQAQDDSLYYDLGRVLVRKSNTKTTTIKGTDLEKYQASNLSDAINVWLYGTYSTSGSIVYVVDGNILTDVNVYSIFDVDEVTLVESATAQASGAGPGRQMVLIKLRTDRKGTHGIEVNGQSSLVDLRNTQPASLASLAGSNSSSYNNYYIAGYRNYKNVQMGVTTEYQRDVDPKNNGYGLEFLQPASFNRFKVSAYLNAKLWKGTTLSFGANYLPQTNHYSFKQDTLDQYDLSTIHNSHFTQISQHLLNSDISIKSEIAKGLTNRFSIAYSHSNYFEKDNFNTNFTTTTVASVVDSTISNVNHAHNFLFRDYLIYTGKLGDFDIQPSLNLTYRNAVDSTNYLNSVFTRYTPYFPDQTLDYPGHLHTVVKRFMATPSVDLNYHDWLDFQGGAVVIAGAVRDTQATAHVSHVYPFGSAGLNLSKLLGITFVKWQLFTSASKQGAVLADQTTTLYNFNPAINPFSSANLPGNPNSPQHNSSYQAGMGVGIFKSFKITYNYEYQYHTSYIDSTAFTDGGQITYTTPFHSRVVTTHVSASYSVRTSQFSYITTLTGTESHMEILDSANLAAKYSNYLNQGHRWSGGMTHRFTYKNVFGGIDLLYQVGERPENLIYAFDGTPGGLPPLNNNSFTVQNMFFGVRFKVPYTKFVELYANGRNLAQNQSSTITDNRRFYGMGFKAGF